jgi:hypothetical protein
MSMGTMSRNQPMAQPMTGNQTQPMSGARTTLAQRQAMTPFRNYNKPTMSKVNPMTYAPNLAQQGMQQPAPNMLEMTMPESAPNMLEAQPSFGGGKSMPGYTPVGYPVEDAGFMPQQQPPQPFNLNPNPTSNMGGGGMQLDLSGMMGTTGQSALQSGQQNILAGQRLQKPQNIGYGGGKTV